MHKLLLLFFCTSLIYGNNNVNLPAIGIGTTLTLIGTLGTGYSIKLIKELWTSYKECSTLQKSMELQGAQFKYEIEFSAGMEEHITKLCIPQNCSEETRIYLHNSWNELRHLWSNARFKKYILSWSASSSILLWLGCTILYGQLIHNNYTE